MNTDTLTQQLAMLPEHDRRIAMAQMARAEALADVLMALASGVRKAWTIVTAPIAARADAYTRERTRLWPHAQA
jgi:hypothetical protein